MTKFFRIHQNNSGGRWLFDAVAGVDVNIVIEAENAEQAESKFDDIRTAYGRGFDSYCECCGERWWSRWDENDATDQPVVEKSMFVHYADGRIVRGEDVVIQSDDNDDYDWDAPRPQLSDAEQDAIIDGMNRMLNS
jgi:hypothetical protein